MHSRRAPREERPRMDRGQRREGAVRERAPVDAGATCMAGCSFLSNTHSMQHVLRDEQGNHQCKLWVLSMMLRECLWFAFYQ